MSKNVKLAAVCAAALLAGGGAVCALPSAAETATQQNAVAVKSVKRLNPTTVEVLYANNIKMTLDFYGPNIFRVFMDPQGGIVRNPKATPEAEILVKNPRRAVGEVKLAETRGEAVISTPQVSVSIDKANGLIKATNRATGKTVFETTGAPVFADGKASISLVEDPKEYFYGGGVQNGRFSHKGRKIAIENQNSWTDGGVCSPAPYYWSTGGYGLMWHTFKPGLYDFGATKPGTVNLSHDTDYLDLFVTVNDTPVKLLNDYYQLTGNPVLLPKFGFYQGHLNAYNRDYWKVDSLAKGITLFEDGKHYKESQKNNGGIKESLNGELPGNYQFSARAVVDRYLNADMPLGWVLPNDGYGAGYGQTSSLDGNVENLRQFGDYARSKGVEIGLWTQSDLHPKPGIEPLLQRDIVKEVRDAGVRVLKTDVAWVGYGYSFGLNGVADVAQIMPYYGNDARPFIISLDGWAGTQRYAGIWSGDQTGGEWEYIRFHIPTYIGSGLAGNPNISSDMDGIFGGAKPIINTRDFQWKTFTPMQLNMDGWGSNPKYPQAMGEPYTSINRHYLKLKSELMPYAYTYAREAVDGKPLIRAMFLDYPSDYTYSPATRYQYLYGPDFLVAPVYQNTASDAKGNDIRNGIYLPEGEWVDYFNGDVYKGNRIINYYSAPVWKLPVFVRRGAIIPMNNPHNNPSGVDKHLRIFEVYPAWGTNKMTQYDDDGTTEQYRNGAAVSTPVEMNLNDKGVLTVTIDKSTGNYAGFEPLKRTELIINASAKPKSVEVTLNGQKVKLKQVNYRNLSEENTWCYDETPELNRFATKGSEFSKVEMTKNPQIVVKLAAADIDKSSYTVTVKGYKFDNSDKLLTTHGVVAVPAAKEVKVTEAPYSLLPKWRKPAGADYCEIDFDGQLYSTLTGDSILISDLKPSTKYNFRLRGVNADGPGEWVNLTASTLDNPLEFAITGIKGRTSQPDQPGFSVDNLFDLSEANKIWHSEYHRNAIPCELTMDLVSVNNLDRLEYVARQDLGNGTLLAGTASYSMDGNNWSEPIAFEWKRDNSKKVINFAGSPQARYVRLNITNALGNYCSGREIYVFRTPGTESWIQGDINKDGKLDDNDLTSYMNYTGLRRGDGDFDYVSIGDVNNNGLIDAYDISLVATALDGGIELSNEAMMAPVEGSISVTAPKKTINPGEEVSVVVKGIDLKNVNALSFALPYDAEEWEFVKVEPSAPLADMTNLTYDRLHTAGDKVLYPTFVNRGAKQTVNGTETLMTITFKARKRAAFTVKPASILLVGPNLKSKSL